eukprot:111263-Prymnesium_polylepis.1
MGHSEAASGMIGCVTALDALKHKATAANAQLRVMNPLLVQSSQRASPPLAVSASTLGSSKLHMCGVTAFGMSGIIGHVLFGASQQALLVAKSSPPLMFNRQMYSWQKAPQRRVASSPAMASTLRTAAGSTLAQTLAPLAPSQRRSHVESAVLDVV